MDTMRELWQSILDIFKERYVDTVYRLWFSEIEIMSYSNGVVELMFPNRFKMETVKREFDGKLHEAFIQVCGFDCEFVYHCPEELAVTENTEELENLSNDAFTFDNFISGPSNKFAYTAAKAIAQNPGGFINDTNNVANYNPLFIYGSSGLGKTHLLFAIKNEVERLYPDLTVKYIAAEEFVNEFVAALGDRTTNEFHEKYRNNIDVLLVDDIQFIAGKTQTEEEFFHTFNSLVNNGKQVVLTSDRPPKQIHSITDRLRSRFVSGLLADIQAPEFETRCAIIKRKAKLLDFEIDDDIVDYIAKRSKSNIRQLEGITKRLHAMCNLTNEKPTISLAQNAIKKIIDDDVKPLPVTIQRIVDEVSRTTGVSTDDIYSKKRTANISNARKMCFYIIRNVTDMSFKAIGSEFGKDHTTVMYNIDEMEKKMLTNSTLNSQVLDIINNIKDEQ